MNQRLIKYRLLYLLFLLPLFSAAENIKSIGVPYIQNYRKSVYLSGNQNWSIVKDKNGIMYFGNAQGLLSYDGKYWQQYQMPNRQIVRSVAASTDGIIYTGGFGEFGYWSYKNRNLAYTSLIHLIPPTNKIKDEIWKIYTLGEKVIFQSFSAIYIYENKKITVVTAEESLLFLHKVNERFYVEVIGKGLFELAGNKLKPLKNNSPVIPQSILCILPYKNGNLLIGTSKDGLFEYNGEKFTPLITPANTFLKTYQLNNGTRILGRYFAFGTILNGLIIIDENGNIVQRINKSSGLQNNTVLSLYADEHQNLWTGLDNGIDRVELNSPLYFYFDKTGLFGTVYSSLVYKNNIYLGTNQGLYFSSWSTGPENFFNSFDFKLIPNSQGQVWDLSLIDDQLLCGHNDGTFKVTGNTLENISTVKGGWTIKKLGSNPEYLIQGTYNGLVLFKKDASGQWKFYHKIENFGEPSRYVEQDARGDIWVSHAYKGLYRLTLSTDLKKVINIKNFDAKNGLPGDYNINIFSFQNKLIFSSDQGFLTYDEISNSFTKYAPLNKELGSFASSNKIISAGEKKYWFINHGKMGLVNLLEPGKVEVDSSTFSILDGRMVQYYENISKINNNIYLMSVDDGFVIYNATETPNTKKDRNLPAVLIRKIEDITDTYHTLSELGNNGIEIPFSRNNIRISFALPYYRHVPYIK